MFTTELPVRITFTSSDIEFDAKGWFINDFHVPPLRYQAVLKEGEKRSGEWNAANCRVSEDAFIPYHNFHPI